MGGRTVKFISLALLACWQFPYGFRTIGATAHLAGAQGGGSGARQSQRLSDDRDEVGGRARNSLADQQPRSRRMGGCVEPDG